MTSHMAMAAEAQYNKTILDNGLTVVTERIPAVRSVSMGVWIKTGTRDEKPEQNGISHFIEHMVFKGTTHRTTEEIAQSLETVGGHLNAFTSKEQTCYYAKVLDEDVPLAVDVLADLVCNPLLEDEEVTKEKQVVIEEIKNLVDTPDELVHDLFARSLFEPHPLAWPIMGASDKVGGLHVTDLRHYMAARYTPERIVISAAGNLEHAAFTDLVQKHFLGLSRNGRDEQAGPIPSSARIDVISKDIAQAHLCVGGLSYPFKHPCRFPLLVLNTLLGGGMSSRLFQNIREKEGLAYAVFSFFDFFCDTGVMGVYAGADASRLKRILQIVMQEFQNLSSTPVPDDELARTKSQLKGSLMLSLESTGNRMMRLARMETYLGAYADLDATLADIDRVTSQDVQSVAQDLFRPETCSITVLGPVPQDIITRDDCHFNSYLQRKGTI